MRRFTSGNVPVIGFAAYSGTGKTTLLKQLLPRLKRRGLRVGVIKHAHHQFDIDYPGKDSFEIRAAGAQQVLIGSAKRWALITERPEGNDPSLAEMLAQLTPGGLDLIIVEGFRDEAFPKIELHRPALKRPLLSTHDASIIAIATDAPLAAPVALPVLDLNDAEAIENFVIAYCRDEV